MYKRQARFARRVVGHRDRFVLGAQRVGEYLDVAAAAEVAAQDEMCIRDRLLGARHGPESVGQVVVLYARMRLYGVVTAVVVGQQQSFGDVYKRQVVYPVIRDS